MSGHASFIIKDKREVLAVLLKQLIVPYVLLKQMTNSSIKWQCQDTSSFFCICNGNLELHTVSDLLIYFFALFEWLEEEESIYCRSAPKSTQAYRTHD